MRIVRCLFVCAWLAGVAGAQLPESIALSVEERSGVTRDGDVVTAGVPFPVGALADASHLQVLDGYGEPVPTQCSVMSRWWKPAHDDSVRWLRVSFPATVPANGRADYVLVRMHTARPSSEGGVRVTETDQAITIATGAATFEIPRRGPRLIARAALDGGAPLIDGDGATLALTAGAWPEQGVEAGAHLYGIVASAAVEERGPVRAVVCLRGGFWMTDADNEAPWCPRFSVRLTFFVDSPEVRIVAVLENSRLEDDIYCAPVEDLSIEIGVATGADASARVLASREVTDVPIEGGRVAKLYQDSSGGREWRDLTSQKNYARWMVPYTKGERVRGVTFRGYRVYSGDEVVGDGGQALGAIDLGGARGGVSVAQRDFRERYPSCVAAGAGRLRLAMWPAEFADPLFLEPGQRFTREYRLRLRGPGAKPDLDRLSRVVDRRLLFRPDPAWVVETDAWDAGLALDGPRGLPRMPKRGAKPAGGVPGRYSKDALDGIDVGWDWYGWIKDFNMGGTHWNQNTCFSNWVLHGDGAEFDLAEARALWAADRVSIHYRDADPVRYWLFLQNWRWPDTRVRYHRFPGHYRRSRFAPAEPGHQNANPDHGHLAMFMWFEYYCLTGDRHVLDSCLALGRRARCYMWRHNHEDTAGAATGGKRVPWAKRRDPADPTFRLDTRYVGWPLYVMASLYQLTGDRQVAVEARNVAAGLRNTARLSPIGFLSQQINKPGSKDVYGRKLALGDPPTDSASQCYALFQLGIIATGLAQHVRETGDEDALDTLIGLGDLFAHHTMIRDARGRMLGWPYVYGDYWGPHSLDDFRTRERPSWFVSNFRVVQPMGWIARLTGRRDYLDVLDAALATLRGDGRRVIAAKRAVSAAPADAAPPAAVSDLRATHDGGAVVLEWTAPAGAARYQLKRSSAPIVERVSGWPDRTAPLPTDAASWEAKAAAFNATQRAFWAVVNLRGEPRPGAAGTAERYRVDGLTPGVHHFALKAWGGDGSLGALSNVVRIELPAR